MTQAGISHAPCHVSDILPTIMEITGTSMAATIGERMVQTPDGESFLPLLQGRPWTRDQPIAWEHEGNCAIRHGNLKLVKRFEQPWELYDMEQDRTELHDLAPRNPALCKDLEARYDSWAQQTGVQDWRLLLPRLLATWNMGDVHG